MTNTEIKQKKPILKPKSKPRQRFKSYIYPPFFNYWCPNCQLMKKPQSRSCFFPYNSFFALKDLCTMIIAAFYDTYIRNNIYCLRDKIICLGHLYKRLPHISECQSVCTMYLVYLFALSVTSTRHACFSYFISLYFPDNISLFSHSSISSMDLVLGRCYM